MGQTRLVSYEYNTWKKKGCFVSGRTLRSRFRATECRGRLLNIRVFRSLRSEPTDPDLFRRSQDLTRTDRPYLSSKGKILCIPFRDIFTPFFRCFCTFSP